MQTTTYEAKLRVSELGRTRLDDAIQRYRALNRAQYNLQADLERVKPEVATAIEEFKKSLGGISPSFAEDLERYADALRVDDLFDKGVNDILTYGFFDCGRFNFVEALIDIRLEMECTAFPRLALCKMPYLRFFDPTTSEVELGDLLRWDDDPQQDSEFQVDISFTWGLDKDFTAQVDVSRY